MSRRRGVPGEGQMILEVDPAQKPKKETKRQRESREYVKKVRIGVACYSLDPKLWKIWYLWDVNGVAVWAVSPDQSTLSVLAAKEVSSNQAVRWDPSWPLPKTAFKWDTRTGRRISFTPRILARAVNRVHPLK